MTLIYFSVHSYVKINSVLSQLKLKVKRRIHLFSIWLKDLAHFKERSTNAYTLNLPSFRYIWNLNPKQKEVKKNVFDAEQGITGIKQSDKVALTTKGTK